VHSCYISTTVIFPSAFGPGELILVMSIEYNKKQTPVSQIKFSSRQGKKSKTKPGIVIREIWKVIK